MSDGVRNSGFCHSPVDICSHAGVCEHVRECRKNRQEDEINLNSHTGSVYTIMAAII